MVLSPSVVCFPRCGSFGWYLGARVVEIVRSDGQGAAGVGGRKKKEGRALNLLRILFCQKSVFLFWRELPCFGFWGVDNTRE